VTELIYRLAFAAPVGVFAGHSIAGLVDRTVVRAGDGTPYIPGSTVKGRLRYFAERLAATLNDSKLWHVAATPDDSKLWCGPAAARYCKHSASGCAVCRLFGSPHKSMQVVIFIDF
jgi:CRISPR/Cas system CSM-associated protein Csm3 (group 7 of RAMP superfamily)